VRIRAWRRILSAVSETLPNSARESYHRWATLLLLVGFGLGAVGFAAAFFSMAGNLIDTSTSRFAVFLVTQLLGWLSIASLVPGCWFLARYKGRSGWWSLLALLWCMGAAVVPVLPKVAEDEGASDADYWPE